MSLSTSQLATLTLHAEAGDRVAYYETLESYGVSYASLALQVVLNSGISGDAANQYFLNIATRDGISVSHNQLATISHRLMLEDLRVRIGNNGTANVDEIQRYHEDVFLEVVGASRNAWTADIYLRSFETQAERQTAWDNLIAKTPVESYTDISFRRVQLIEQHYSNLSQAPLIDEAAFLELLDPPSPTTSIEDRGQQLVDLGFDPTFVGFMLEYTQYLYDLQTAGWPQVGDVVFGDNDSNQYGPYQVNLADGGEVNGGNHTANTIQGSVNDDVLYAFDGNDRLMGGLGIDRLYGGDGNDTVDYSAVSDGVQLFITDSPQQFEEWEALVGPKYHFGFVGKNGGNFDTLINIEIMIGTENDDVFSLSGDLVSIVGNNSGDIGGFNSINLGGSQVLGDSIVLAEVTGHSGLFLTLDDQGTLAGATTSGTSGFGVQGVENIIATEFDDHVVGNKENNIIVGGSGEDALYGDEGDDLIVFDNMDVVVSGGADNDVARFDDGGGLDQLIWDARNSNFEAEAVLGGSGDDTFFASSAGGELFSGGNGNDTFSVSWVSSSNSPTVIWGGDGADNILFSMSEYGGWASVHDTSGGSASSGPGTAISDFSWTTGRHESLGIAIVNVENLNEDNFQTFDYANLEVQFGADWAEFDVILLNPDAADAVSFEMPDNTIIDVGTVVSARGHIAPIETITSPDGLFENPFHIDRVVDNYDLELGGQVVSIQAAASDVGDVYLDSSGDLVSEQNYRAFNAGWGEDVVNGGPPITFSNGSRAYNVALTPNAVGTFTSTDAIGSPNANWFIYGGAVSGTSLSADGSVSIVLEDVDPIEISSLSGIEFTTGSGSSGGSGGGGSGGSGSGGGSGGGTGPTPIIGTAASDTLIGGDGQDTISGENGNDVLRGGLSDDSLSGGAGDDTGFGGDGDDILDGGAGNDLLEGNSGNDTLIGGAGDDTLRGNVGDDLIEAGDGNDVVIGGDGIDTLEGGAGNDTLNGFSDADLVEGGAGNDLVLGGAGNDTLSGSEGMDTLRGEGADDIVFGGADNDLIFGSSGDDTLYGDEGDDVIEGNTQADQLFGDAGKDTLRGGDGFDLLEGGADNDVLVGGNGEDTLGGGAGQDTLRGNAGNDTFVFVDAVDSSFAASDLIDGIDGVGIAGGDIIDLSGIDADTSLAGDQAFTFLGAQTTADGLAAGVGALWLESVGGQTRVYGLIDNDAVIDLAIRINDGATLAGDYVAGDFTL